MKHDWEYARYHVVRQSHKELRKLILLDAAMVSCSPPISASGWVRQHLVPVFIQFPTMQVLGLFSAHLEVNLIYEWMSMERWQTRQRGGPGQRLGSRRPGHQNDQPDCDRASCNS